jgi:hypothetical protein
MVFLNFIIALEDMQCSQCEEEASLTCCQKSFCSSCIGLHMMQLSVNKHKPLSSPSDQDQSTSSSIKTRLTNELLELEEFKNYSIQVIQAFCTSLQSQVNTFCVSLQNLVLSKCFQLETELKLSLFYLISQESSPVLDLFKSCKSPNEVKQVKIFEKSINCFQSLFEDVLNDSITFQLELCKMEDKDLTFSNVPRHQSVDVSRIGFSNPVKSHHFPKVFVPYVFHFKAFSSKIEFFEVKSEEVAELSIDGEIFPSMAAWSVSEDGKVILTGGINDFVKKEGFLYSISEKKSERIAKINTPRFNHAQISVGCYIYIIGGRNNSPLRDCERFSLSRNTWSPFSKLIVPRECPSVCHHSNHLYVFGGAGVESIETCDLKSTSFKLLNIRLPIPGKCCAFAYDSKIFILLKTGILQHNPISESLSLLKAVELAEVWPSCEPIVEYTSISWISNGNILKFNPESLLLQTIE